MDVTQNDQTVKESKSKKADAEKANTTPAANAPVTDESGKIKTRQGSGYLKQLYSTARTTAGNTHSNLKSLTTFMVNLIPVEKVDASELQVRVHFDDAEIEAMAHSIREHGVLQPILVVQDGDRYKVIAGERRLRGAKRAGIDRIPARVLSTDDKATHEIALRENLDRVDLHPIEEGEGYVSLLEALLYPSHDAIAKGFGKPKSRVTECIGFTRLPESTKAELLKIGIKNRALLRHLLTLPAELHMNAIREASDKEEILMNLDGTVQAVASTTNAVMEPEKTSKEFKPFEYKLNKKGLNIPSFRWKLNDGSEKLEAYSQVLKKLLSEIETRLNSNSNS